MASGYQLRSMLVDDGGNVRAQTIGSSGWMDTDGCEAPALELVSTNDSGNLTDVTVEVQQWWPAP